MEKDPDTNSRWREEKVLPPAVICRGDGKEPEEGGSPAAEARDHARGPRHSQSKEFGSAGGVSRPSGVGCGRHWEVIALGDGGKLD